MFGTGPQLNAEGIKQFESLEPSEKRNGNADLTVMEVESGERSSIEHRTPHGACHPTFGIAPH